MDMNSIIIAAVVIAAVGIIVGVGLGLFGAKFKVEVDEKEAAVREELPGNNCGGCGYPGCDGLAKAIAEGKAPVNACPVGGAPVGEKIAAIMGVEAGSSEKKVAFVKCKGTCDKTKVQYEYHGIEDCAKASVVPGGGAKACSYGCTGFGTCVKACKFDAIHVVDGVAVVDKEKCVACGSTWYRTRQNIWYSAAPTIVDRLSRQPARLAVSAVRCVPSSVSLTQSIWITT